MYKIHCLERKINCQKYFNNFYYYEPLLKKKGEDDHILIQLNWFMFQNFSFITI